MTEETAIVEAPRKRRPTGWLKEKFDDRGRGEHDGICGARRFANEHFGAPRNLPTESIALANAHVFHDQGPTETCVGHGLTAGAHARIAVAMPTISFPYGSPRAVFTLSNMLLRKSSSDTVSVDGTFPRTAFQASADFGVPAESEWPLWVDGKVQDPAVEVPPDVLQRASGWKLKEQFTFSQTGNSRSDAVAAALAQNYPVPCAGSIDQAFEDYDGIGVITAPDPKKIVGGHMTCILGYRTVTLPGGATKREWLVANSWLNWGVLGGMYWADEAWLIALDELYAFTLTVGPTSGAPTQPAPIAEDEVIVDDGTDPDGGSK